MNNGLFSLIISENSEFISGKNNTCMNTDRKIEVSFCSLHDVPEQYVDAKPKFSIMNVKAADGSNGSSRTVILQGY